MHKLLNIEDPAEIHLREGRIHVGKLARSWATIAARGSDRIHVASPCFSINFWKIRGMDLWPAPVSACTSVLMVSTGYKDKATKPPASPPASAFLLAPTPEALLAPTFAATGVECCCPAARTSCTPLALLLLQPVPGRMRTGRRRACRLSCRVCCQSCTWLSACT